MRTVFVDTVGLIALWDQADQWHQPAAESMQKITERPIRFVTTEAVFLECGNAAARKPYRSKVFEIRSEFVLDGALLDPSAAEIDRAWAAYASGKPGAAGIVDHLSFEVMRRLGVTEAFTNDRHFVAAGFEVLF